MTTRWRRLFWAFLGITVCGAAPPAGPPLKPFRLRIVREIKLPQILNLADCIPGKLYLVDDFSISDPAGTPLGATLELPWRANGNSISAIPAGQYAAHQRTDGTLGWRLELSGTGTRTFIEIHPGNTSKDTEGCILVGASSDRAKCALTDSRKTLDAVKGVYGSPDGSRPIEIEIVGN